MMTSFSIFELSKVFSRKPKEKKIINSFVVKNNIGQSVQIRPGLCRPIQKSFSEKFFKKNDVPKIIFIGNLETAQTRAANRHYYEKVLKLSENTEYELQEVVYNDPRYALEQEEKGFVFSNN